MVSVQGWPVVCETEGEAAAEAALLRAGQRGDRTALERLFLAHQHAPFTLCYGIPRHHDIPANLPDARPFLLDIKGAPAPLPKISGRSTLPLH